MCNTESRISALESELAEVKQRLSDREAELLRCRTHENAASVELDSGLDDGERKQFKALADELAEVKGELAEALASIELVEADLETVRHAGRRMYEPRDPFCEDDFNQVLYETFRSHSLGVDEYGTRAALAAAQEGKA